MKMIMDSPNGVPPDFMGVRWCLLNNSTFFAYTNVQRSLYICENRREGLLIETGCGQAWIASITSIEMVVVHDEQGNLITMDDVDPVHLAVNSKLRRMQFLEGGS